MEDDICGQRRVGGIRSGPGYHLRRTNSGGKTYVRVPGNTSARLHAIRFISTMINSMRLATPAFRASNCIHRVSYFQAEPPDVSRIPVNDALGVTVVLLTCSYRGHEFVRVGYFINNEYTDAELRENPPPQPQFDKVQRNILGDKPRVTRFKINWDDCATTTATAVPDGMDAQALEETSQDAPTSTLGFTENTQNGMEVM